MARTGPKSSSGKAIVARNAIRHGVFAKVPVVPHLEREEDWEAHREGILASLRPANHLEYALVERIALLLWRQHRVARFEAERVRVEQGDVERDVERRARARAGNRYESPADHAEHLDCDRPALKALEALAEQPADRPVERSDALELLDSLAKANLPEEKIDEDAMDSIPDAVRDAVDAVENLTYGDLRRFVEALAAECGAEPDELLLEHHIRLIHRVDRAQAHLAAHDTAVNNARTTRLILDEDSLKKIVRYEAHLSRQLNSTLHELEALQARRQGQPTPLARVEISTPA